MDEITKAEAFALAELFNPSFPLKEWLLGAAKRSESRRRCSDSNLYLQERNLWLLAAKLAGSELLGDGTHAESVGRNSEENCGNVRSETSRRWQCVLSWLEATAEENVEYFEHSTHRSAVNIDSDCVEGVVSRALALTPDTCLTAASMQVRAVAEDERARVRSMYLIVRAGRTKDAASLNFRVPQGLWSAVVLRGGDPWDSGKSCASPKLGNRQLQLWRHCCKQRCRKALKIAERLQDNATRKAMKDVVWHAVLAQGRCNMEAHVLAATLHASVVATAEACLYEAAIHAIFGGDVAAFTRARPRASWEDYGWARIKCAEASTAVDTASLHEHSLSNRLPLRPEESALAELNALPGTTLQTLSARLGAHGAAAIPEFLLYPTEDDGSTEYAAICRVKATLACIWRRVAGMGTSILAHDALCDQWLARYAVQLSTSPMTIQLAAFYSAPLHRARLQHVAECFSGANNACEIDSCLEAAKEALGAEAVPELACRVCDQFVQKVQKNGALSLSASLTSGNRARNFFALGWLAAVPLELVRHANSILTDLGLSAIMHCDDVFWIDVDAALAYIPNTALDTVVDVACARGPHDVFATALLKIHLGWRTIRLAIRCINTWQDVPLRALAQTTSIDCGPATKSAHQCSTATYDTLVATFAFPMQSSLKASFTPVHIQADCLGADDTKDAKIDLQWRIDVLLKTLVGPLVGGFLPKLGWLDLGALQEAASIGKTKIDHSFRVAGTVLIHATDVARTTADALSQRDQPDLAWHWYINCLQLADILAEPEADGATRLAVVCATDIQRTLFRVKASAVELLRYVSSHKRQDKNEMNNADWHFLLAPGHDHHNHKGTPALLPPLPHTPSGGVEARGKFDALQPQSALGSARGPRA